MHFSEMMGRVEEKKVLKTDLLLVISSYVDHRSLLEHLKKLEKQTYQRFNVLLILGVPFQEEILQGFLAKKSFQFGIIIARENERRGCSGAFFAGQKYALENNYKYVIMADDDCMPVDSKLVQELYRNRVKQYVAPTMTFVLEGYRKKGILAAPTSYSLISARLLRDYGLYYMPLFHGADDAEFMERVKVKPFQIKNKVEHPYIVGMRLFGMFDRAWLFLLQGIMIVRDLKSTLYNLAVFVFMSCVALCFLPPYGRRLFFMANSLLLTFTYGKKASDKLQSGYKDWIVERDGRSLKGFRAVNENDPASIDQVDSSKFSRMASMALEVANKDVVVENSHSFLFNFFLAICARNLYVKVGQGRYLVFAKRGSIVEHALRLVLFAAVLPLQALAALLFLPIKAACYPDTYRYGID